jgi:hypothetical protein
MNILLSSTLAMRNGNPLLSRLSQCRNDQSSQVLCLWKAYANAGGLEF